MTLESSGILGGNRWKAGSVWMGELFGKGAVWEKLCWVVTFNRVLTPVVGEVMGLVAKGEKG